MKLDQLTPSTAKFSENESLSFVKRSGMIFVYDSSGIYRYQITQDRFDILYNLYCGINKDRSGFDSAVFDLLTRYQGDFSKRMYWSHNPIIYGCFLDLLPELCCERFASPLDVHVRTRTYYSPFKEDGKFGANYDAFSSFDSWSIPSISKSPFAANIMYKNVSLALHSVRIFPSTFHIITTPFWQTPDYSQFILPLLHDDNFHFLTVIPPMCYSFTAPISVRQSEFNKSVVRWPVIIGVVATRSVFLEKFCNSSFLEPFKRAVQSVCTKHVWFFDNINGVRPDFGRLDNRITSEDFSNMKYRFPFVHGVPAHLGSLYDDCFVSGYYTCG